jgi:hypothetical protein
MQIGQVAVPIAEGRTGGSGVLGLDGTLGRGRATGWRADGPAIEVEAGGAKTESADGVGSAGGVRVTGVDDAGSNTTAILSPETLVSS